MNDRAELNDAPSFDGLGLGAEVRRAIDDLGFLSPTPVQVATYGPAVRGEDLVVQARTGTGKTAAFGLPLVDKLVKPDGGQQVLVLAIPEPSAALMLGLAGMVCGMRPRARRL